MMTLLGFLLYCLFCYIVQWFETNIAEIYLILTNKEDSYV